jgi:hypothetical protein
VDSGVLKSDKRGLRQIHCSPILEIPSARDRLYKKAQEVFAGAERKIKMGMLLFEGGFFLEASTPGIKGCCVPGRGGDIWNRR